VIYVVYERLWSGCDGGCTPSSQRDEVYSVWKLWLDRGAGRVELLGRRRIVIWIRLEPAARVMQGSTVLDDVWVLNDGAPSLWG